MGNWGNYDYWLEGDEIDYIWLITTQDMIVVVVVVNRVKPFCFKSNFKKNIIFLCSGIWGVILAAALSFDEW